jgi:Uma2 family endonuclease
MLPEHVEELNRVLASEHRRRQKFYEEITEDCKWEFINGQVIMHSPATNRHNRAVARLFNLLLNWTNYQQLGQVTVEKTLCQFPRNDYEPDIVFFGTAKAALLQPETLLHPIPDFVVEVLSPSTESFDRGVKLQDYQAHGVQEYWIIDAEQESVEQFLLSGGQYAKAIRDRSSRLVSSAIAGFDIPVRAIFDDAINLSELRRLLEARRE